MEPTVGGAFRDEGLEWAYSLGKPRAVMKGLSKDSAFASGEAERDPGKTHIDLTCSNFVCGDLPTCGPFRQRALQDRSPWVDYGTMRIGDAESCRF